MWFCILYSWEFEPAGRAGAAAGVPSPAGQRRNGRCHRTRPRRHPQRGLCHRHGAGRRRERRPRRGNRHAGGDPGKSGEYYRKIFITKRGADAAWHLPPSSIFLFAFRDTAQFGTEALRNIFFPDIFDEIRKLCGFAYGIDHDALPMLC